MNWRGFACLFSADRVVAARAVKGADYPSETFRVLKKNEIARFGEYRTARLVVPVANQIRTY